MDGWLSPWMPSARAYLLKMIRVLKQSFSLYANNKGCFLIKDKSKSPLPMRRTKSALPQGKSIR